MERAGTEDRRASTETAETAEDLGGQDRIDEEPRSRGNTLTEIEEIARLGTWDWDIRSDLVEVSDGLYRIFGLKPGAVEFSRDRFLEIVIPEDRDRVSEEIESALNEDRPYSVEFGIIRPDGSHRDVHSRGRVYRDSEGTPVRMMGTATDVTQIKEAEEETRRQARQIELLLQTTLDGYILAGTDGQILDVNPSYCALVGYSREELSTMNIQDLEVTLSAKEISVEIESMVARGKDRFETKHRCKDGRIVDLEVSFVIMREDQRDLVAAFVRDITEKKRAVDALQESEQRFREIAQNIREVFWLFDWREQRVVYASPAYEAIWGRSVESLYADYGEWGDSIHPEDREAAESSFTSVLETGGGEPREYRITRPDGEARWISDRAFAIRDESGSVVRVAGVAEDVTDRKREEAERLRLQQRFHEMAQHIREVFWLLDWIEQRFIYVSPAFEMIWGRSLESVYADSDEWVQSIHSVDRDAAAASFVKTIETGGGEPREYRITRPDGEIRWISERAFAIRDDSGSVVRIAGIAEDVTDVKREAAERRRFEAKMQHAQKLESLGVLAGGIAHDFNNLLMAILGNADLAKLHLAPESPGREYIDRIGISARRAAELTNQMLAYSGRGLFQVQPIQLNLLVEEMTHLLDTVISKKAHLDIRLAEVLPTIQADASQLRQIVMNLITNASESLGDQSGTVRVVTGLVDADRSYLAGCYLADEIREGRYVYLEVSDTGCGMDENTRERIFDPFFTTKFTGRGLGLAAVLGIVRGHHGTINVDSEPGRGSTIRVLFPAAETAADPAGSASKRVRQAQAEGATILVVDDEPEVLDVATAMLETAGFRVVTAADGREATEVFRRRRAEIALVLLDMTMPRMGGEEALAEMRLVQHDVPVILTSGYSEQEATSRFADGELAGFLQKPYGAEELLERVSVVFEQP